jgi:hypothetical protein
MPEDREMTPEEVDDMAATVVEAQIGALQAYALFMEELVAAMLVARLAESRATAIEAKRAEVPELVDEATVQRARQGAFDCNEAVRALFERGASLRLACAKVGALDLDKPPMVDIPDAPAALQ